MPQPRPDAAAELRAEKQRHTVGARGPTDSEDPAEQGGLSPQRQERQKEPVLPEEREGPRSCGAVGLLGHRMATPAQRQPEKQLGGQSVSVSGGGRFTVCLPP